MVVPRALEADPNVAFDAAAVEAARIVPDAARSGPALHPFASPLPPFSGVDRSKDRYVGEAVCAACHPAAAAAWTSTRHAVAWAALEQAVASARLDCVGCHSTGYLHPGGYGTPDAPPLTGVQCEACHGPGSSHVAAGGRGGVYGELPASQAACVACHTWNTAPDFRYTVAWEGVAHGL